MLCAGVARVDISPKIGVAHAGWGAQTHQVSLGNDMPLLVTALVVTNHDIALAIVDVDILLFTPEQDQDIRQIISDESGIPFDNIRLAYTHTHSGPITFSQWIKDGVDLAKEWWSAIPAACAKAVSCVAHKVNFSSIPQGLFKENTGQEATIELELSISTRPPVSGPVTGLLIHHWRGAG